jgi:hypothetical protein
VLGEDGHEVQDEPPVRGVGVDLLDQGAELDSLLLQELHGGDHVGHAVPEPIYAPDEEFVPWPQVLSRTVNPSDPSLGGRGAEHVAMITTFVGSEPASVVFKRLEHECRIHLPRKQVCGRQEPILCGAGHSRDQSRGDSK